MLPCSEDDAKVKKYAYIVCGLARSYIRLVVNVINVNMLLLRLSQILFSSKSNEIFTDFIAKKHVPISKLV